MSSRPSETSLLGIPGELRLQIYDEVVAAELNCTVVSRWDDQFHRSIGFQSHANRQQIDKLDVPWLNLMLSCKAIAVELRSYMGGAAFSQNTRNTTYTLDLASTGNGKFLGNTAWQKLPCAPNQARIVTVSYDCSSRLHAWADGGPTAVTRALYQTLNHLMHCGPSFNAQHRLTQPMHIQQLRVYIDDRHGQKNIQKIENDGRTQHFKDPVVVGSEMGSIFRLLAPTGIMAGFIDQISLHFAGQVVQWPTAGEGPDARAAGVLAEWQGYGFEWGMDSYMSAKREAYQEWFGW